MAQFGMLKSFNIDNGELAGLTPQECFVLGYELAQIDEQLKSPAEIKKPVHAGNRTRIIESCNDANREFTLNWSPADPSESWMTLDVKSAE